MPSTYEPISTISVSGTTTSAVTFSSIPSTYTDLVIIANVKSTSTPGASAHFVRFNGDTASNYSRVRILGSGSSASSFWQQSNNISSDAVSSIFGLATFNVMNYSNTTTNKSMLYRDSNSNYVIAQIGLWRSTSAITSISLTADQGFYDAGSTFTLYGIKAA